MSDDTKARIITLGGAEFPIAPLTLGAMRNVGPAFTRIGIDSPAGMDAQISVITAAMAAADPGVKRETVDAIVGVTFDELKVAIETIGRMMGLGLKDPAAGEAAALEAAPGQALLN
jgi:hypothetical protein